MYLIAIAWLYVVIIVSVSDDTILGGVLTFVFWGYSRWPCSYGCSARRQDAGIA